MGQRRKIQSEIPAQIIRKARNNKRKEKEATKTQGRRNGERQGISRQTRKRNDRGIRRQYVQLNGNG